MAKSFLCLTGSGSGDVPARGDNARPGTSPVSSIHTEAGGYPPSYHTNGKQNIILVGKVSGLSSLVPILRPGSFIFSQAKSPLSRTN